MEMSIKINKLICDSYKTEATVTNYTAKGSYFNPQVPQSLPTLYKSRSQGQNG